MKLIRRSRPIAWDEAVVEFRHGSIGLVRARWRSLTLWMLAYNLGQYLLLLMCVRMLGATNDELGWIEVLRRLRLRQPADHGGDHAERGGVRRGRDRDVLVAAGGDPASMTAAVLLYSALTYLAEIPLGALGWLRCGRRAPAGGCPSAADGP